MTGVGVFYARDAVMQAAKQAGVDIETVIEQIRQVSLRLSSHNHYLRSIFVQL
jgi:hypothetical protein